MVILYRGRSSLRDELRGPLPRRLNKAFISIAFQVQTKDLAPQTQSGQPLFGLNTTSNGRIVISPGGIPLVRDGEILSAVGVSSDVVEQDREVAEAGVPAF